MLHSSFVLILVLNLFSAPFSFCSHAADYLQCHVSDKADAHTVKVGCASASRKRRPYSGIRLLQNHSRVLLHLPTHSFDLVCNICSTPTRLDFGMVVASPDGVFFPLSTSPSTLPRLRLAAFTMFRLSPMSADGGVFPFPPLLLPPSLPLALASIHNIVSLDFGGRTAGCISPSLETVTDWRRRLDRQPHYSGKARSRPREGPICMWRSKLCSHLTESPFNSSGTLVPIVKANALRCMRACLSVCVCVCGVGLGSCMCV